MHALHACTQYTMHMCLCYMYVCEVRVDNVHMFVHIACVSALTSDEQLALLLFSIPLFKSLLWLEPSPDGLSCLFCCFEMA